MNHLGEYIADCRELDERAFQEKHGEAFLVSFDPAGSLRRPANAPHETITLEIVGNKPRDHQPLHDLLVFPLRLTEDRPLDFYSIGRTGTSDVFIPDDSVSIFHAVLIRKPDGRILIRDAGSKNGTALNDEPVPEQGDEEPPELESGDRIRLGLVELSFLRTEAFRDLVQGLS